MHACFGRNCPRDWGFAVQVLALWWQGHALHGVLGLLDTPAGRLAAALLSSGQRLGASLRCWTSLQHESSGASVVLDDCQLIT